MKTNVTIPIDNKKKVASNVNKIFANKGELISTAFDTKKIKVGETAEGISYSWNCKHDEDLMIYADFLARLTALAAAAKRVNKTSKECENEKYTFRALLLRMGYSGDEDKHNRRILMRYLNGDSAVRGGRSLEKEKNNNRNNV